MSESVADIAAAKDASHAPEGGRSKGETEARAHLEKYLEPGEKLLWADRAASPWLGLVYFGRILYAASIIFPLALAASFSLNPGGYFGLWALPVIWNAAFLILLYFIGKYGWGIVHLRSHYYGLTDRRALIAVGRRAPKSITGQDFNTVVSRAPFDDRKRGRIHLYTVIDRDYDQDRKLRYSFYGIGNARRVAVLIEKHLLGRNNPPNANEKEDAV